MESGHLTERALWELGEKNGKGSLKALESSSSEGAIKREAKVWLVLIPLKGGLLGKKALLVGKSATDQ